VASPPTSRASATTVHVHPREQVDLGLVPLDAGTRMRHGHILEHAEAGMMTTLAVIEP